MKPVPLPPVERPDRSVLYDEEFIEQMRDHPNEWFVVEVGRTARPSYGWAKKRIPGLEVATRKNGEGGFDVYARVL